MEPPRELSRYAVVVEEELARHLRCPEGVPAILAEAMSYSARGGKRIRGALTLGACAAVGGREADALPAAVAVELVHAFSLVHDDLPCMDDDSFRRGRPTCHKAFGEATALLAGDGLLVQGLAALAETPSRVRPERILAAARVLLAALGPAGLIGGQALDMLAQGTQLDLAGLHAMDAAKTGALIRAAARIGAILGGGSRVEEEALGRYGAALGLAFQIVDDLLDLTGDRTAIGRPPGSDLRNEKATYPALLGLARARVMAEQEIGRALAALEPFGERGAFLAELARYVGEREG